MSKSLCAHPAHDIRRCRHTLLLGTTFSDSSVPYIINRRVKYHQLCHSPSSVNSPHSSSSSTPQVRSYNSSVQHRKNMQMCKSEIFKNGSRELFVFNNSVIIMSFSKKCFSQVSQKDSYTKKKKKSQALCHPLELQNAFHRQTASKSCLQLLRVVHPISRTWEFCILQQPS